MYGGCEDKQRRVNSVAPGQQTFSRGISVNHRKNPAVGSRTASAYCPAGNRVFCAKTITLITCLRRQKNEQAKKY